MCDYRLLEHNVSEVSIAKMSTNTLPYDDATRFYLLLHQIHSAIYKIIEGQHCSPMMWQVLKNLFLRYQEEGWLLHTSLSPDGIYEQFYDLFAPWVKKRSALHPEHVHYTPEQVVFVENKMVYQWIALWHEFNVGFVVLAKVLMYKDHSKVFQFLHDWWYPDGHNAGNLTCLIHLLF